VDIRRELAAKYPAQHDPYLARSLFGLLHELSEAGRLDEEALKVIQEAVGISKVQKLVGGCPAEFRSDVVSSFNNLTFKLSEPGCQDEAFKVIWKVVEIC